MESRERPLGGWSAIVEPDEKGFEEEALTDPHMVAPDLAADDRPTVCGPLPDLSVKKPKPSVSASGVVLPQPQRGAEARRLKLPVPGKPSGEVSGARPLPLPQMALGLDDVEDKPGPAIAKPEPSSSAGDFSAVDLVDKFQEPIGSASAAKKPSSWRDYKEVIRIALIGVVLISGVIAYQLFKAPETIEPAPIAQPAQPATPEAPIKHEIPPAPPKQQPIGSIVPVEPTPVDPQPAEEAPVEQRTERTKTPMVTIVSSPPGAMIEINGELYGNTPLIMPSPSSTQSLSVKLKLDKHKKWEGLVTANEAGHFSINIKMEPLR